MRDRNVITYRRRRTSADRQSEQGRRLDSGSSALAGATELLAPLWSTCDFQSSIDSCRMAEWPRRRDRYASRPNLRSRRRAA